MTERLKFLLTFTPDYYHNDITERFGEFVLSCKTASHSQISHSQTKLKTFMKLNHFDVQTGVALCAAKRNQGKTSTFS